MKIERGYQMKTFREFEKFLDTLERSSSDYKALDFLGYVNEEKLSLAREYIIKNRVTYLNIYLHYPIYKFDTRAWKKLAVVLKDINIFALNLSAYQIYLLDSEGWKAFGDVLKVCNIKALCIRQEETLAFFNFQELSKALEGSGVIYLSLSGSFDAPGWETATGSFNKFHAWEDFGNTLKSSGITHLELCKADFSTFGYKRWQGFKNALNGSSVTALKLIDCSIDKLTIWGWKKFEEALKGSYVTSLNLDHNNFSKLDIKSWQVLDDIIKKSNITSLELGVMNNFNKLDTMSWHSLVDVINGSLITSLDLENNSLSELKFEDWQSLSKALKNNRVTSLSLRGNSLCKLDMRVWKILGEAFDGNTVTFLDLSFNDLYKYTEKQWQYFVECFAQKTFLILDLQGNNISTIDTQSLKTLAMYLRGLSGYIDLGPFFRNLSLLTALAQEKNWRYPISIAKLDLSKLNLSNEKIEKIFSSLLHCIFPLLKSLDLSFNNITCKVDELAKWVQNHPTIQQLDVSNNCITYLEAKTLIKAGRQHTSFTTLNLSNNLLSLTTREFNDLNYELNPQHNTITQINVSHNSIGSTNLDTPGFKSPKPQNKPTKALLVGHGIFISQLGTFASCIDPKLTITPTQWVIHLFGNQEEHAMLFIEGQRSFGQRFLQMAHFGPEKGTSGLDPHSFIDLSAILGNGKVQTELYDIPRFMKTLKKYAIISWERPRGDLKKLQNEILNEEGAAPSYFKFNTVSSTSRQQTSYNCLTWALNKLASIEIVPEQSFLSRVFPVTNNVIKDHKNQRQCKLM